MNTKESDALLLRAGMFWNEYKAPILIALAVVAAFVFRGMFVTPLRD